MTRTEAVLRQIVDKYHTSPGESRTDCWTVSIQQRDLARQELAAIESDRQRLSEPINPDWLRARGLKLSKTGFHLATEFMALIGVGVEVWLGTGLVCVNDGVSRVTVGKVSTMSRGRFLALCSGCGIEVQP